jgi:hypothetical protein
MKQQVSTPVVVVVVVLMVGILGYFMWNKANHPYAGGNAPPIPMKVDLKAGPQQMSLPSGSKDTATSSVGGMSPTLPGGSGGMTAPGAGGMTAPGAAGH